MLKTRTAAKNIGILMALVLIMVISGCSHQPVGEPEPRQKVIRSIRAHLMGISEPDRRARCLNLLDAMAQGLGELNHTVAQYGAEAKRLNADYQTDREDFNQMTARFNTSRESLQKKILTAHFGLKALTTQKEWAVIADMEEKAVNKVLRQNLLEAYSSPEG